MEDRTPPQLETNIERRKLRELLEIQEIVRSNYLCKECKERVMRSLQGKFKEHEIDLANNGNKVYYKKVGEDKWRGLGEVIGNNDKTIFCLNMMFDKFKTFQVKFRKLGKRYGGSDRNKKSCSETSGNDFWYTRRICFRGAIALCRRDQRLKGGVTLLWI